MDHPCFFDRLFECVGGDFQTGGGRVCPFRFDGSVFVLSDGMPGGHSTGRYQNNRPDPASSFCRHKRGCGSIDKQHKSLSRHSALQFAGSRAMLAVNFRLWWCKVQFPKSPKFLFRAFLFYNNVLLLSIFCVKPHNCPIQNLIKSTPAAGYAGYCNSSGGVLRRDNGALHYFASVMINTVTLFQSYQAI